MSLYCFDFVAFPVGYLFVWFVLSAGLFQLFVHLVKMVCVAHASSGSNQQSVIKKGLGIV